MAKNARIDVNSRQSALALLNTDGKTITRLVADPVTGALGVNSSTAESVIPLSYAETDENGRTTLFAVSEDDGQTPVALQCDSNGNLLVKEI